MVRLNEYGRSSNNSNRRKFILFDNTASKQAFTYLEPDSLVRSENERDNTMIIRNDSSKVEVSQTGCNFIN